MTRSSGSGTAGKLLFALLFSFGASLIFIAIVHRIRFKNTVLVPVIGLMYGGVLSAIAEFYVTGECTGEPPVDPASLKPVPTLDVVGLSLLGLLSAGLGALGLRRRKNA